MDWGSIVVCDFMLGQHMPDHHQQLPGHGSNGFAFANPFFKPGELGLQAGMIARG